MFPSLFSQCSVTQSNGFSKANQPCIPGINLSRDIYIAANLPFFIEEFYIYAHEEYWSIIFFSFNIFIRF